MADDIIGSLGIQIEADASDLPGQYDAAVAASQEAAGRIGQAFESLIGIGAALEITEGIKAFGEAALEAYGDIEKTSISIEHMTGSIAQTTDILEQVRAIGLSSPFSFPELQDTTQKMIAMGVPVEKIGQSLQGITDAAAATGKSLLVAGGAFDRITETGSAAARQLAQLGVTTERLGDVMGVTKDQVLAAFKALPDQAARIDVLNQAMERFAGSAEAQAAGIQGAWQILENRFELVMQAIGQALEPAAQDITAFGTTVAKYAQEAADGLNQLPGPVKEVGGLFLIAAAALVPLTAGIATLGIGVIGVQAAIVPFNALLTALGLRSAEAAVAQGAEAAATTAQGVAAVAATPEVVALAAAEGAVAEGSSIAAIQLGLFGEEVVGATVYTTTAATQLALFGEEVAGVAVGVEAAGASMSVMAIAATTLGYGLAALVGYKVGEWATGHIPGLESFTQAILKTAVALDPTLAAAFHALTGGDVNFGGEMEGAAEEVKNLQSQLATLGITVSSVGLTTDQYIDALRKARAAHQDLDTSASAAQIALDHLAESQKGLQATFEKAQATLALATKGLQDGTVSAGTYEAALKAVDDAQKKLNAGSKDYQDTLGGLTEAYGKQQGTINTLQNTIAQLLAVTDRTQEQDTILAEATNKLTGLLKQQADAHGLVTAAVQGQGKAYDNLATSADAFMAKEIAVGVSVQQAKAVLDQLTSSTDTSAEHTRAVNDALKQYTDAIVKSGGAMTDQIAIEVNGVSVLTTVGDAINKAKDAQNGFNTTTVNGVQVIRDSGTAHAIAATQVNQYAQAVRNANDNTSQAINFNSSLAAAIDHTRDATSDEISVNNAWNDSISTSVDNASKFVNSINGVTAALHNMATAEDEVGTAAFDAGKGLEGMNGQTANALQYVAGVLALSKSPATAGMVSESAIEASEQALHKMGYEGNAQAGFVFSQQLYDAMNGVTEASTKTSAALTTTAAASTSVASSTTAASSSLSSLSSTIRDLNASATQTSSTTDGLTTSFTTANQAVDFAGMTGTQLGAAIGKLGTELLSAGVVVDGAGLSAVDYATKLQATVDGMNASAAAVQQMSQASQSAAVGIATAAAVVEAAGAMVSGVTNTGPSQQMQDALTNMTSLATPGTTDLGSKIPNILATFNGQVITGSPGMSLSSALATQDLGIGSGSSSTGPMPLYTGAPQPTAQPITVNMNYPVFSSQGQSQQTMKDIVSQIRTVTGIKQ